MFKMSVVLLSTSLLVTITTCLDAKDIATKTHANQASGSSFLESKKKYPEPRKCKPFPECIIWPDIETEPRKQTLIQKLDRLYYQNNKAE